MERYKILCTPEQTKKALELGAPIEFEIECPVNLDTLERSPYPDIKIGKDGEPILIIPTAEQMVCWLEEQGISVKAICFSWCNENKPTWQVHAYQKLTNFWDEIAFGHSESCKEATLSAIDAALDYLSKNKK